MTVFFLNTNQKQMATGTANKRKYLLFAATDGRPDSLKPCAFFASAEGCKNGANCRFSHSETPTTTPAISTTTTTVATTTAPVKSNAGAKSTPAVTNIHKSVNNNKNNDSDSSSDEEEVPQPKRATKTNVNNNNNNNSKYGNNNNSHVAEVKNPLEDQLKQQQEMLRKAQLQLEQQQREFAEQMKQLAVQQAQTQAPIPQQQQQQQQRAPVHEEQKRVKPDLRNQKPAVKPTTTTTTGAPSTSFNFQPLISTNLVNTVNNNNNNNNNNKTPGSEKKRKSISNNNNNKSNNNNNNDDDDSDVMFDAVNLVVGNSNQAGLSFVSPQAKTPTATTTSGTKPIVGVTINTTGAPRVLPAKALAVAPAIVTNALLPAAATTTTSRPNTATVVDAYLNKHDSKALFVPPQEALIALGSSGTDFALFGNKKQQQQVQQQQQQQQSKTPITTIAAATAAAADYKPLLQGGGLSWEQLVQKTREHPRYQQLYTLKTDSTWVNSKAPGEWCRSLNLPPIVAIDCEMCECEDPLTGDKDGSALIRVSAVNGLNPQQVLLDMLVQPSYPITSMRTNIHGITKEQLDATTTATLRHAQAAILKIVTSSTVLVGHSLHNDLNALKLNHSVVIDTAYLFQREGAPSDSPSLREVCLFVLQQPSPEIHDSIRDATMTMLAANLLHQHGFQPPIPNIRDNNGNNNNNNNRNDEDKEKELFVHRVPDNCTETDLFNLFISHTNIVPNGVTPITHSNNNNNNNNNNSANDIANGRCHVQFVSAAHCNLAFESIAGPNKPDKANFAQKRVYLQGGGYLCIRKCIK